MIAFFLRTIRLAIKSLMLNLLRSSLTILGIVFGVFSVIAMLAIGEGASAEAQKQVLQLGATNIIVVSVKPPEGSDSGGSRKRTMVLKYGLLRSDYEKLRALHSVEQAIPIREITKEIRYGGRKLNVRLVGCTADYLHVTHLNLSGTRSRFISDQDQQDMLNVAVIAHGTAQELFPLEDPIGKAVRVGINYYKIVGVTKHRDASAAIGGSLSGQDYNLDLYIPLRTFRVRIGDMNVKRQTGSFSAEQVELNQITLKVGHRDQVVSTAEAVREILSLSHTQKDFGVVVPLELLKQADQIRYIFNGVLGSIAMISLFVGGIGIMNIMLATVTERTREIGIRRALGARQFDIKIQFLTETAVLSSFGGLLGVLLGIFTPLAFRGIQWFVKYYVLDSSSGASEIAKMFSEMSPQVAPWSIPVAFSFSVLIGLFSGLYPAFAAAKLHPIEALRHE